MNWHKLKGKGKVPWTPVKQNCGVSHSSTVSPAHWLNRLLAGLSHGFWFVSLYSKLRCSTSSPQEVNSPSSQAPPFDCFICLLSYSWCWMDTLAPKSCGVQGKVPSNSPVQIRKKKGDFEGLCIMVFLQWGLSPLCLEVKLHSVTYCFYIFQFSLAMKGLLQERCSSPHFWQMPPNKGHFRLYVLAL